MNEPSSFLDVVDVCRELIALPSENPPGDESAVAHKVADMLTASGFEVERHEAAPNRPNIVARLRRGAGRRLIFQAHADTKPATAPGTTDLWTLNPFCPEERSGLLYGLGACDTKGGLAAQLVAACALAEDPRWSGELTVQAVADEEDGSQLGAGHLLEHGLLEADAAIVAEPTGCLPSLAQLGNAWAEITVSGRAAHAGTPERGNDAFRAALRYVADLDARLRSAERDPEYPGHPRLNVGHLSMPGHPGTVPGECRLRCDIRVLPGRRQQDTFAFYAQAAATIEAELDVTASVAPYQGGGFPSHRIDASQHLAEAFRAAQRLANQPTATTPFAGGTDARFFAAAGTPAVVYGPGRLEQAHAPDEYVPIADLYRAERELRAVALAFLGVEVPRAHARRASKVPEA